MQTYPFHKYADPFPMISEKPEEWKAFVADIKANGVKDAVVLYQGAILDGRNRHNAAHEAGVEFKTENFEGGDDDAIDFVILKNIRRRHLTATQCSAFAAKLVNMKLGDNQHQQGGSEGRSIEQPTPTSVSSAVDKTPGASVATTRRLLEAEKEVPGILDDALQGKITAHAAQQQAAKTKKERVEAAIGLVHIVCGFRDGKTDEEFHELVKKLPSKIGANEREALVKLGTLPDDDLRAILTKFNNHPYAEVWKAHQDSKKKKREPAIIKREGAKQVMKTSAPLEHKGNGADTSGVQLGAKDFVTEIGKHLDALWLNSADAREHADKIERLLEKRGFPTSERIRDSRAYLRTLQERAPKKKAPKFMDVWEMLRDAFNAAPTEEQRKYSIAIENDGLRKLLLDYDAEAYGHNKPGDTANGADASAKEAETPNLPAVKAELKEVAA